MISLVRVDDRLIHGQVTVGWAPYLKASRIIVVNDRLAASDILTSVLRAGGSAGMQIDVISVADAARLSRDGRFDPGRVIVLFESLDDVSRALEEGMQFQSLNLGGLRGRGDGLRISDAVVLSPEDRSILRRLRCRGISIEVRLMPGDHPDPLPEEMDE